MYGHVCEGMLAKVHVRGQLVRTGACFPSLSLSAWLQIPLPTESFHQLVHIEIFRKLRIVLSSYLYWVDKARGTATMYNSEIKKMSAYR